MFQKCELEIVRESKKTRKRRFPTCTARKEKEMENEVQHKLWDGRIIGLKRRWKRKWALTYSTREWNVLPLLCIKTHSSCAWLLAPNIKNQGKGMLEVYWLAVELREWFASSRSTFHCLYCLYLPSLHRKASNIRYPEEKERN